MNDEERTESAPPVRRRRRPRGWGGVGAMAAACAATAAATLLPLVSATESSTDAARGTAEAAVGTGGQGVARARQAEADQCDSPEASLRPDGKKRAQPNVDAIKKRGRLVVGVDQSSYRWGYRDPNESGGALEGFDIALVHAIAERILGDPDKVQYRAIPTSQRIPALQHHRVDMVVRTMTISCARLKQVAFSTAYFKTGQQVLAPKESRITGYDDSLKGKRVCSAKGSTALDALKEKSFGADISTVVPNQLDCLVRLQLGEADAVVTDGALAAGQAAQDPSVELKGEPFTTEFYGVAMNHGADDLVREVNKILEEYRKSGWKQAYDDWLKAGMGPSDGPPAPKYR
ncbi:glutamate ABC transporter substrate-binding protein [Streptomyces sp. NPDC058045]|uniref:glutamate ABC transporter substrate-binding protein n=1 Tax=Streptomyces sp. NPDC058045 TaxID=3346311 RepID=UPI0036E9DF1C